MSVRRSASCRGPRPASIKTPKPSASSKLALPELPLASTVKCMPIRVPSLLSCEEGTNNCLSHAASLGGAFSEEDAVDGQLARSADYDRRAQYQDGEIVFETPGK